jgi:hypothetical protein
VQNEWLDHVIDFERQFAEAGRITVRERLGAPAPRPLSEIPPPAVEPVLMELLERLADRGVLIDFMGEWSPQEAYQFIVDELLDEEIDDIQIEGMAACFPATTPAWDVEIQVEEFARNFFMQNRELLAYDVPQEQMWRVDGRTQRVAEFLREAEAVWALLPPALRVVVSPHTTAVEGEIGVVAADLSWLDESGWQSVRATFELRPSPFFGWDVVKTTLLDDLRALAASPGRAV